MVTPVYDLDPDEKVLYGVDWADRLAEDETIVTVDWTIPVTLTNHGDEVQGTACLVLLGIADETPTEDPVITCRIVTSTGQDLDQDVRLRIRNA